MASGRPLFPGSTVEDELHLIFRLLGKWILFVMLTHNVCMRTVDLYLRAVLYIAL